MFNKSVATEEYKNKLICNKIKKTLEECKKNKKLRIKSNVSAFTKSLPKVETRLNSDRCPAGATFAVFEVSSSPLIYWWDFYFDKRERGKREKKRERRERRKVLFSFEEQQNKQAALFSRFHVFFSFFRGGRWKSIFSRKLPIFQKRRKKKVLNDGKPLAI